MKTFNCICGELTFFENVTCVVCGRELGFLPDVLTLSSLEPVENGLYRSTDPKTGKRLYKKCQNYAQQSVCNWMIPVDTAAGQKSESFCASCRLNQTIPDLSRKANH